MIRLQNIYRVFQNEVYQTVTKSSIKLMIGNLRKEIETKCSATLNKIDDWEFREITTRWSAIDNLICCVKNQIMLSFNMIAMKLLVGLISGHYMVRQTFQCIDMISVRTFKK